MHENVANCKVNRKRGNVMNDLCPVCTVEVQQVQEEEGAVASGAGAGGGKSREASGGG